MITFSNKECVLINQNEIYIDIFYKGENGWSFDAIDNPEQTLKLQAIGYELAVTDIYGRVEFETA
jgi:hypothetical protein